MNMERKMNRRRFLAALGTSAAGLALAGCAGQSIGDPGQTQRADAVTLTQWDWWVTQTPWFDQEIALFQAEHPGIRIERVMQTAMDTALPLSYAEDSMPDLYIGGPSLPAQLDEDQILAYDLASFSDFEAFRRGFPTPELDFAAGRNVFDGRVYTAPREARSAWWNQLFVNLDVLAQYGVEPPATGAAFLEACRKITQDSDRQVYGYANGFATGWMNQMVEWQGALSYIVGGTDPRTNRSTYGSDPHFAAMLELLADLAEEGLILPEAATIDDEGMRALFADGRVAFINGGMWNVNGWRETHPDFTAYTVLPPLLLGDEQEYCYYTEPGQTGTPFFISARTRDPEAAWLWYKWLHSPAAGERWVQSGNGLSIFPEANRSEYLQGQAWQDFARLDPMLNRVGPSALARNADAGKLFVEEPQPNFAALTGGVYSGQISRAEIPERLATLAAAEDAAFDTALQDAQTAGLSVAFEDFVFADWDPLRDYGA
jgi:ABC-type glycerol-3-phosphate transport system substrate-binding protein